MFCAGLENKFLPFALPDVGGEEIEEVVDTMKSGWLTTGPKTKRFERDFAAFIGHGVEAIAVNSATAGLHLALEAIGVRAGDEVITTPYTFTATAEVISYLGAHPVFVDICEDTLNIDPSKIEAALSPKTKAIIPVHFSGLACEMDAILNIAKKHDLRVIEDAAHAFPTTYQDSLIGTLESDVVVYSFYATKTMTTGEGGMIVTKNADIAKRCKTMRLHGISEDVFERYTATRPRWYYEVIAPGFKYNMTDIAASLGIHQLKKAYTFQQRRAEIAEFYHRNFADLPLKLPSKPKSRDTHAWHLFVIRLTEGVPVTRDTFIEKMFSLGIGCSVHFIPLHLHPFWKERYHLQPSDFPIATQQYEKAVSLPIYTKMTDDDVRRTISSVRTVLES